MNHRSSSRNTSLVRQRQRQQQQQQQQRGQQTNKHTEWKESLRRACLERARQNRKEILWKKRQRQRFLPLDTKQPEEEDNYDDNEQVMMMMDVDNTTTHTTTVTKGNHRNSTIPTKKRDPCKTVVEQELWQQGISVHANNSMEHNNSTQQQQHSATTTSTTSTITGRSNSNPWERQNSSYDSDSTEYVISEEELYELLQDVEEEMMRSGTYFHICVAYTV